jgi:hypothetical protein
MYIYIYIYIYINENLLLLGNASLSILHEWTQALFPDIPPRLNEDVIETNYLFKNSFTSSTTLCSFKKNELRFESECASTISIIKETVTRLANYRRVLVEEKFVPNDQSLYSFLSLVRNFIYLFICFNVSVLYLIYSYLYYIK